VGRRRELEAATEVEGEHAQPAGRCWRCSVRRSVEVESGDMIRKRAHRGIASRRVVLGALAQLAIAAAPARADRCTANKLTAVGRKEARLLACHSRAAAEGDTSGVATCMAALEARYGVAFGKAGSCSGDAAVCDSIAEACVTVVRGDLSDAGPSTCEARRLRLAGKVASAKLVCNAKAAAKGLSVDAACIQKVESRFQTAFVTMSGCTGDETALENAVDRDCVQAVGADADGDGTVGVLCDRVCCQLQNSCVGGSGAMECTGASGTPVTNGQVCDDSQHCVPPGTAMPAGCCEEGTGHCVPESESSASSCAGAGGVWHASATCTGTGACEDRTTTSTTTTTLPAGPCCHFPNGTCQTSYATSAGCQSAGGNSFVDLAVCEPDGGCVQVPCGYTDATHLACGGACPAGSTCVGQVITPFVVTCSCATASQCAAGSCTMFPVDCAGGGCVSQCADGEHGCPAGYVCVEDPFVCEGPGCGADCSCPAVGRCAF